MVHIAPGRANDPATRHLRQVGWITLILLVAAVLRLVALANNPPGMTGIPPGMTHDEADHGLTAWEIVNGARALYFTVGYGREPLYDYATALLMAGTGPTILAARLTSVYFSLLLIAATYAWARRAFGRPVALLTAAGLAVGFWPLMAGRQALRSITLPAVFALAVLLYWQGLWADGQGSRGAGGQGRKRSPLRPRSPAPLLFFASGLLLGLTFYTYIPARVMWLALPALALYVLVAGRRGGFQTRPYRLPDARRVWSGLGLTLLVAGRRGGFQTRPYRLPDARRVWSGLGLTLLVAGRRGGFQTRPYRLPDARRVWAGLGLTLAIAALVAAPLFLYLANHPGLEARIDELSAPLRAAAGGDLAPLWANARGALRLFTIEGDQTWRYNIPGKPFLGPVMGVLFYVGLVVAGWLAFTRRGARLGFHNPATPPGAFLALVWLLLGFAPVLVTGPGLSMTQAIGALPVLYLFPALALVAGYNVLSRRMTSKQITNYELRITNSESAARHAPLATRHSLPATRYAPLAALIFFTTLAALTAGDYFVRWANAPEVRVQYEATMVAALRYLDERGAGAAAVSTITPGRYHTPAVALLTLHNPAVQPRWFDGRQSLILPGAADSLLLVPGFTPIPAALQPYLAGATLVDELPMRPDDLDQPVRVYALAGATPAVQPQAARFGDHVELLGYELSATAARPGDVLTLVTAWRLLAPLPEASLFAHLAGPGQLLAVADGLGAPGEAWVSGDVLLQLHTLTIPPDAPPGDYPLVVGVYTRDDNRRLMTDKGRDSVNLTTVKVVNE